MQVSIAFRLQGSDLKMILVSFAGWYREVVWVLRVVRGGVVVKGLKRNWLSDGIDFINQTPLLLLIACCVVFCTFGNCYHYI